jgi:transaldolase
LIHFALEKSFPEVSEMKKESYFVRVAHQSPTEFWINNPSREQADLAISHGATGCTNNPSYTQKMFDHPTEGEYARKILDATIQTVDGDNEIITEYQRRLVKPIAEKFLPLFQTTNGKKGFVSIQGDPIHEEDPDVIIKEALLNRKVSPNICCKIPTTEAGLQAMEYLISQDIPLNATEIFAIRQAVVLCETYQRASRKHGKSPQLYISHIAGIYDDFLQNFAEQEAVDISPDVLWQAGLAVARKLYRIMEERQYPGIFIAGGARGSHHFTEMVGGKVCCTINWEGTADKLIEQDPPVVFRLFNPVPQKVIEELIEKLPDFKRGYLEDGLETKDFEEFGPVRLFRSIFTKSWKRVLDVIRERKAINTPAAHHHS